MKTKMPVRRNSNPSRAEMAYRRAIHYLQDACDDQMVLMQQDGVYLIPSILADQEEVPDGTVEYQVSDGPKGKRSISYDYNNLEEAVRCFRRIVEVGWENYGRENRNFFLDKRIGCIVVRDRRLAHLAGPGVDTEDVVRCFTGTRKSTPQGIEWDVPAEVEQQAQKFCDDLNRKETLGNA